MEIEKTILLKDEMIMELLELLKQNNKAARKNVSYFFAVKEKLISIRELVKESQKDVSTTIAKIDVL